MATRFDITRVKLKQYRSIAACNVEVGALNILVGPNGSGKSSFLDAMRLCAQSLTTSLDNALRERGGVEEVSRRSKQKKPVFSIELGFRTGEQTGTYSFQVSVLRQTHSFTVSGERCTIKSQRRGVVPSEYVVQNGVLIRSTERVMPPAAKDRLYLVAAAGIDVFRPVFDGLSGVNVYNISPDAIRQPQPPQPGDVLHRDGSNIASVLHRLARERPRAKQHIEEYLGQVVAGVVGVSQRTVGPLEILEFSQESDDGTAWTFQANSMSDGTLRALGVLVALFSGGDGTLSPVGVEEPEIALHPAAAGLLLGALRDASELRQVFLTTHSPDLLDTAAIKPEELLAVRAERGVTTIGRVDRAGDLALRQSLYTPGELLRVDQLTPEPAQPEPDDAVAMP